VTELARASFYYAFGVLPKVQVEFEERYTHMEIKNIVPGDAALGTFVL
jgi:hypothetical protein